MSTTLLIYIWGVMDSVRVAFGFLAGGIAGSVVIYLMVTYASETWSFRTKEENDQVVERKKHAPKRCRKYAVLAGALGLMCALLPSSSTFAAMVIVPRLIESEVIQKDMPELYEAAKARLMESLKTEAEKKP